MIQQDVTRCIANATELLRQGRLDDAERVIAACDGGERNPDLWCLTGQIQLRRGRFAQAAAAFRRGLVLAPADPRLLFGVGDALAGLGNEGEAILAYRAAIAANPRAIEAYYQLGGALHRKGELEQAEETYRKLLALAPGYLPAKLALGAVLIDAMRPAEAEALLAPVRDDPGPARLCAMISTTYGLALRRQRKDEAALQSYEKAARLDPSLPGLEVHRAEALQNLRRYDDALAMYRAALSQDPLNERLHHHYNDLLYRLGRKEYLESYRRAPQTPALMMGKAFFLQQQERHQEVYELCRDVLARAPADRSAAMGAARALMKMRRYDEAEAAFSALLARHGGDAAVCNRAAELHLLRGDPALALKLCEQGLAASPHDQGCLATLSLCFRMLGDERDEELSGYDSLIQVFDLPPPEGFCAMETFNAELNAYLDRMHPQTREHIGQSLRGGTQTPDHVFHCGHDLIDRLERRIGEAVKSYVAGLPQQENHPFSSRRTREIRYAGSWSSRLKDCGFHVNHIHPQGWISSCYYVAVPEAAKGDGRQGWIKFGEPGLELTLDNPVRRAVQPVPGRLVLFPSYMWHGTIPFHDRTSRTTIAFDILPKRG